MCDMGESRLTYDDMSVVPVVPALRFRQRRRLIPTISYAQLFKGLRRYVAISILTLSVFRLPHPCWSAPMDRTDTSSPPRRGGKPLWVNPCGIDSGAALEVNTEDGLPMLDDTELIRQVVQQAKNALYHAQRFRDEYVQKTFKVGFEQHNKDWVGTRYDWLPSREEIPKDLGEQLKPEQLQGLQLVASLQHTYQALQKFAVGLEQVVMDQGVYDGDFVTYFDEAEYKLKAVLCELQVAMMEKNVAPLPDVGRHIMEQKARDIDDESLRNLRDWFIFRDYMNGLEYTIQVFDYLQIQVQPDAEGVKS